MDFHAPGAILQRALARSKRPILKKFKLAAAAVAAVRMKKQSIFGWLVKSDITATAALRSATTWNQTFKLSVASCCVMIGSTAFRARQRGSNVKNEETVARFPLTLLCVLGILLFQNPNKAIKICLRDRLVPPGWSQRLFRRVRQRWKHFVFLKPRQGAPSG